MSAYRSEARPADAGFSLVEIVVALAVIALILAALPPTIRLGQRAWEMSESLEQRAGIPVALRLVEQRLGEARQISLRGAQGESIDSFRGTPSSIAFVAPEPPGERGGLYLYRVEGTSAGLAVEVAEIGADGPGRSRTRTITPGPATLGLRFFGSQTRGEAPVWQTAWDSQTEMPVLVELQLRVGNGSTARTLVTRVALKIGQAQ